MRHTISVTVENKFGVLARVAGLFSARGYNISSLAVSETLDAAISCMTIVVEAKDELVLEQIKKQLNKLIDVITVTDYTKKEHIERELVLTKVACASGGKKKLEQLLKKRTAKIIQLKEGMALIEMVGEQSEIQELLTALDKFGVKELIRTGKIAIA
jgi:acetolactate synthase-1/3 small subunit